MMPHTLFSSRLAPAMVALVIGLGMVCPQPTAADDGDFIPRRQSEPPGPPLSAQEALEKITVPEGFLVELVASEPDVVNPVSMTFDERGRIWITESVEYPRKEPGPGEDRIKVFEDTTGDGVYDKATVFADGLNIPCGIAIGHGGVWVANAPDILFLKDTTGDGVADHREVVVTGFGRADTHELPNTLTWGPDGWLYGLNGVFNPSVVVQNGKEHRFTCAVFRIHPVTHEFQIYAEGTSNPWGIAFDPEGSMFISACVIDHLWHITESGYYHRQSGAYPAFTWKIESIVKHRHQMAAYCGLVYFDSDAWPEEWRDTLFMGNIHGGAINADKLERRGSSYFATPREDIFKANDVWFMPVSQQVGPDGNLYILDWYDRYHCYQDAMRDPEGVNRTHGRIWRLRHEGTEPVRAPFPDLAKASDDELIEYLHSANVYHRETAHRMLAERNGDARDRLKQLVLGSDTEHKPRMHALFALVGGGTLDEEFHLALLNHELSSLRAWGARAAGNAGEVSGAVAGRLRAMTDDEHPDVLLQVAIAAPKIEALDAPVMLAEVLAHAGDDQLIPRIAWENLHPLLEEHGERFLTAAAAADLAAAPGLRAVVPRASEGLLSVRDVDATTIAALLALLIDQELHEEATTCLNLIADRVRSGEVRDERLERVREHIGPVLAPVLEEGAGHPWFFEAAATASTWGDERAIAAMRHLLASPDEDESNRMMALEALASSGDEVVIEASAALLRRDSGRSSVFARSVLQALGRMDHPAVPTVVLEAWQDFDDSERPVAIEVLTQRTAASLALLEVIGRGDIERDALNHNQIAALMASEDEGIRERVVEIWGRVRTERNPDRESVIAEVNARAHTLTGDTANGRKVFQAACAACHKIHGEGSDIGPDITNNGRGSFEQLLSNVLDPNLVVGADYQLRSVTLKDGRVLAGMIAEENDQRVVLKMIGGQLETIARDQVARIVTSPVSFMPDGLEQAMSEQDMIDLLAYLSYDLPPDHPDARLIPGAPLPGLMDADNVKLPGSVGNLLVDAKLASNMPVDQHGKRGEINHMLFDPGRDAFVEDSRWHEYGVLNRADVGVVSETEPVWWMAEWDQAVEANLILLSGTYPNQPQPNTGWTIELRVDGRWVIHDRGIGGWYDSGRYGWGGPGHPPLRFDAIRISLFSKDNDTRLNSLHFRGEPGVSWVVAKVPEDTEIDGK